MNVVGISFFGIPAMLIGANENVGYGATSTIGNVLDIFMLTLDRDNYHYIYKGKRKKMKQQKEIIKVKGQDDVKFNVYSCVYGPVFAWGEGVAFAQKQSWEGRTLDNFVSVIKLMQSKNGAQFREACSSINSAVTLGYADRKGNFGYV
jgi:acyl-homoserine lactone acylase PvdQ